MALVYIAKRVGIGLAGGLTGSLVMSVFSGLWSVAMRGTPSIQEETLFHQGGRPDVEAAKKRGDSATEYDVVATTRR